MKIAVIGTGYVAWYPVLVLLMLGSKSPVWTSTRRKSKNSKTVSCRFMSQVWKNWL